LFAVDQLLDVLASYRVLCREWLLRFAAQECVGPGISTQRFGRFCHSAAASLDLLRCSRVNLIGCNETLHHRRAPGICRRERNGVSQPPTPWAESRPVM